jgi:hypothetical protein
MLQILAGGAEKEEQKRFAGRSQAAVTAVERSIAPEKKGKQRKGLLHQKELLQSERINAFNRIYDNCSNYDNEL